MQCLFTVKDNINSLHVTVCLFSMTASKCGNKSSDFFVHATFCCHLSLNRHNGNMLNLFVYPCSLHSCTVLYSVSRH